MKRTRTTWLSALVLSFGLVATSVTAYADTGGTDVPNTDEQTDETANPKDLLGELDSPDRGHDALSGEFTSLAGALLQMQADQAGMSLGSYLKANDLKVKLAGDGTGQLAQGSKSNKMSKGSKDVTLNANDAQELSEQLYAAGFGLDVRNYKNLDDIATDVLRKAHTADGAVTLAGAKWVSDLGAMRVPKLTDPKTGKPVMPGIMKEGLPFGLLMDKSIANTVLNAPDLFAQTAKSGLGSDALQQVFNGELKKAWDANGKSLMETLPDKCTGVMMSVMATGTAKSADKYKSLGCPDACTTGGLYLNGQANRMFSNEATSFSPDDSASVWNAATLSHVQDWRLKDLLEQNPAMLQGMLAQDGSGGGSIFCHNASASTKTALVDVLPGVFGGLKKK